MSVWKLIKTSNTDPLPLYPMPEPYLAVKLDILKDGDTVYLVEVFEDEAFNNDLPNVELGPDSWSNEMIDVKVDYATHPGENGWYRRKNGGANDPVPW